MSDQFGIDPEELRRHAASVAGVADQLSGAAGALPSDLSGNPLGVFCEFLSSGLQGAMGEVTGATNDASASIDQISAGLRSAADDYQRTDDGNSTDLEREYA